MSVSFKEQYFRFNKVIENHQDFNNPSGSYCVVSMSSNWKKSDNSRVYSDWIAKFKKSSAKNVLGYQKGDLIICSGTFTREPFESEGSRKWGDARMTVFECRKWVRNEQEAIENGNPPDDEIPY